MSFAALAAPTGVNGSKGGGGAGGDAPGGSGPSLSSGGQISCRRKPYAPFVQPRGFNERMRATA
eukprot:456336-Prymnesium_polylepis.1